MQNYDQRSNLKKDSTSIALVVLICAVILMFTDFSNQTVIYDCRDAHWQSDVPSYVKEECRRIMQEELERMTEEEKIIRT